MTHHSSTCRVAIIGAGPYGLAAAAHLRSAGVEVCIFGEAMDFWVKQMPKGMALRSSWDASHISDPAQNLTLDRYLSENRVSLAKPIPLEGFVKYGQWFQQKVAPDLDRRRVLKVEPEAGSFRLYLNDGESIRVERLVVAAGISPFAHRLPQLQALPREFVSHTSEHCDYADFGGRRVIVIGGGQSALESAALLHEAGAEVEVIVRSPIIHWLDQRVTWLKNPKNPLRPVLYPRTDVGPPILNWIVALPRLFQCLPRSLQARVAYRSIRPAGSGWLVPRLTHVPLTTGRTVVSTAVCGKRIALKLDDGTQREADHLFQATGYAVNISQYPFIPAPVHSALRTVNGYPELGDGFESSLPGLHFIGAPAAYSFGPVCRFVSGTPFTARTLAAWIAKKQR